MKKLMIAAASVLVGLAANANAVNWGLMNVTPSSGTTTTTDYTAYYFVVSGWDAVSANYTTLDAVTSALSSGDTSILSKAVDSRAATVIAATGNANFTSAAIAGKSADAGSTITAFSIIVDGDESNYLVAKLNGTGDALMTKTVAGTSGAAYAFSWNAQGTNNTNWQSIPEPTSGLLLLLGVAGLALRRRRA